MALCTPWTYRKPPKAVPTRANTTMTAAMTANLRQKTARLDAWTCRVSDTPRWRLAACCGVSLNDDWGWMGGRLCGLLPAERPIARLVPL